MSAGGVIGGAFITLLAPAIFASVVEFPLLLALSLLAVPEARRLCHSRLALPVAAVLVAAVLTVQLTGSVEYRDRSFFGVVSTRLVGDGDYRVLVHGTTVHGAERLADIGTEDTRPEPLTYYAKDGPLASAIAIEQDKRERPLAIGLVGLGVGSLACYREAGESWTFYEIDPAVVAAAKNPDLFTFLSSCAPDAPIVAGDARLSLAREPKGGLDALVVDAFSSDAIPVHLLTREALRLYADKVTGDGVVAIHISNRFMELASVVAAGAAEEGLFAARQLHIRPPDDAAEQKLSSDAVVIARGPAHLAPYFAAGWKPLYPHPGVSAWTDDYSNVVGAIMRKQGLL
jgi:hypothetical protein